MGYKHLKSALYNEATGQIKCTFFKMFGGEHEHTFEADRLTPDQIQAWVSGTFIQNAMPNLTADEREMFICGDCSPFETKH